MILSIMTLFVMLILTCTLSIIGICIKNYFLNLIISEIDFIIICSLTFVQVILILYLFIKTYYFMNNFLHFPKKSFNEKELSNITKLNRKLVESHNNTFIY